MNRLPPVGSVLSAVLALTLLLGPSTVQADDPFDREEHLFEVAAIHPDCADHPRPRMCTAVVLKLQEELNLFRQAFLSPTPDLLTSFHHPLGTYFLTTTFVRGKNEIRALYTQLLSTIVSADLDTSTFRFQVIDPCTVITYGRISGTLFLADGSSVPQTELPITLVWTCRDAKAQGRTFLIAAGHE